MKSISAILNLIIICCIISLCGCKKNFISADKQEILFQVEILDGDQGKGLQGFFIDINGQVYTYSNPEGWNYPDTDFVISQEKMDENLSKCVYTDLRIKPEEVGRYSLYIDNIASSKVTAAKHSKEKKGTTRFICFRQVEENQNYRGFIIRSEGEISSENLNFYSKKIVTWLREVHQQLPGN